jgi:hypothetical protein
MASTWTWPADSRLPARAAAAPDWVTLSLMSFGDSTHPAK